jgi:hypothetical protein
MITCERKVGLKLGVVCKCILRVGQVDNNDFLTIFTRVKPLFVIQICNSFCFQMITCEREVRCAVCKCILWISRSSLIMMIFFILRRFLPELYPFLNLEYTKFLVARWYLVNERLDVGCRCILWIYIIGFFHLYWNLSSPQIPHSALKPDTKYILYISCSICYAFLTLLNFNIWTYKVTLASGDLSPKQPFINYGVLLHSPTSRRQLKLEAQVSLYRSPDINKSS